MTYTRISEATATDPVLVTDLIPIARPGDTTARSADVLDIIGAIPRVAVFTTWGVLDAVTGQLKLYNLMGYSATIEKVYLAVGTAPTSQAILVDVNINGTSIFSPANRPTILAGATTGQSTTFATSTWADGEYLTADIDQVGSVERGRNLVVHVVMKV